MSSENSDFESSPEHEDWIIETGGSDEARDRYYQVWERRIRMQNYR